MHTIVYWTATSLLALAYLAGGYFDIASRNRPRRG